MYRNFQLLDLAKHNMVRHHIITNDLEFHLEFLRGIKNRVVDEKFLYLGSNAKRYYENMRNLAKNAPDEVPSTGEMLKEITSSIIPSRSTAYISVGCGNSQMDAEIVSALMQKVKKIEYFGVDSSRSMLQMSEENVKGMPFDSSLIVADFMSRSFANEIKIFTKDFDQRVFVFWDNTIGNMSQTACVDSLYNIMEKNDIIVLEVSLRDGVSKEDEIRTFKKYISLFDIENEKMRDFLHYPLKKIDLEKDIGKLIVESFYEDSVGAVGAKYSFEMMKPKTITFRNEVLHFLPPERISILELRRYNDAKFIEYFEGHDFGLKSSLIKEKRGLFTFERF